MKKFSFRQFRFPSKGDDEEDRNKKALKRREQVRKAQHTHRERKDAYVKSLEKEVLQLRTNEAELLQKTNSLNAEVIRLQRILAKNRIPHESNIAEDLTTSVDNDFNSSSSHAMIILDQPQNGTPHIRVTKGHASSSNEGHSHFGPEKLPDHSHPPPPPPKDIPHPKGDLDITEVGMDFVLTLEDPCLAHAQGSPEEPEAPTGHALTATASLLFQASGPRGPGLPSVNAWEAPHEMLDRLLQLSESIPLEGEVTPIKAWNHIRHLSAFRTIDSKVLGNLTRELSRYVKCYGFGAVIDETIFEDTLRSFGLGRIQ
ncbi:hypothetical protein DTO166G4_2472 [Paecilomyces variotii]|nr:hypothetical protein DTO166G4_2472 [Paecilomyces variotii]KAJ9237359.1 hypothetical protein DTO169E5_5255 [Paecilomyces variotii]KAJ9237733.1 hypothetical protein DTO166G5_3296 [Paecilomyces variotii]KAJ9251169.1 hypothetical protein DTO207G8_5520 [Paecilomyces variotii]KAJ9256654.1 hypothetical protein DTO195F2_5740 [Paecilomyces variotii]